MWSRHNIWIIVDDIVGAGEHDTQSHWQIPGCVNVSLSDNVADDRFGNLAYQLLTSDDEQTNVELLKGANKELLGWNSLYYGRMEPTWTIRTTQRSQLPLRGIVVVVPQTVTAKVSRSLIELQFSDGEETVMQIPEIGRQSRQTLGNCAYQLGNCR